MPADRVLDAARLAALRDTELLNAPASSSLERLNRLAVEFLDVPISLVSVVGAGRQVFASQVGLPEPWASSRGTPLSHSFCQHVVGRDAPLTVCDARTDRLLKDNLAVRDLAVIAYAGVPVRLASGETLGSFCAIDHRPRDWDDRALTVLHDLAALAAEAIELRRAQTLDPLRDHLTGLPHRVLFEELVERANRRARRDGTLLAVLAVDLVGFRLVNEALGQAAGDRLLIEVARRLQDEFRSRDTLCRTDADHFLLLCECVPGEAGVVRLAQRLRTVVTAAPFRVGDDLLHVAAKVGYATSCVADLDAGELVETAAAAVREQLADRGLSLRARRMRANRRLRLRNELAHAHRRGEMHLAYQPIAGLASGRVKGYEALLRWQHPELARIAPAEFIPIAEDTGAIVTLGEWTLRRACAQLARWRRDPHRAQLTIAVNVAPLQLAVPSFVDAVAATLRRAGLPPDAIVLEVTERTLLEDHAPERETMHALRRLGVRVALDDFGTGYSAIGYLTQFPIDILKIDRTFTAALAERPQAAAIVRGIIAMADGLGLCTVAEGIETASQLQQLEALGCRLGQGYLLGRPSRPEELRPVSDTGATRRGPDRSGS